MQWWPSANLPQTAPTDLKPWALRGPCSPSALGLFYTPRFRPGSSMLYAAFPACVLLATSRFSGLGPPCYTPLFRPGSSMLHAAFPAWVLATRRFSGLGPPCYKPLFRPGSSMLHAAFDLAGYIALPVWVLTGSCIVHRELPAWFSLGHSGYTAWLLVWV